MRILLIHNFYQQAGGEDTVFRLEGELLEKMGHQVERITFSNQLIRTVLNRVMSGILAVYNPASARLLRNRIESYHPDIIHLHNFLPLASPSVIIEARKQNIPIVLTLHNYRLVCPSATLFYEGHVYTASVKTVFPLDAIWKGVYRNSSLQTAIVALVTGIHHFFGTWRRGVSGYIALSHFSKSIFEHSALSLAASQIAVKPNFAEDHGCGDLARSDFFLFVGRLSDEKGVHVLLKAAIFGNFKLVIIGDGPLRDLVNDSMCLHENILYLGFQKKISIIDYMKRCKALLFPSIWYEGFPLTLAEAFSTGTPVIASDLGGMKEIIQDKVNGLLFTPGNEYDLAAKVDDVSADKSLLLRMSEMARRTYLLRYTPEKNYQLLMDIYQQAIEKQRPNGK